MKKNRIFNLLLCCIMIFTSTPLCVTAQEADIIGENTFSEYVENEIIITTYCELNSTDEEFTTASADFDLINLDEENLEIIEELDTYNTETNENTYVLSYEGDVIEKCKELETIPGVKCAEPNQILHTMGFTMPNEITSSSLYSQHMKWYFDLMQIPQAWQTYENTGEEVIVAVIDNGFKINATEFPKNLWSDENGNHGWNTSKNSADISPIYKSDGSEFNNTGHGTHVAGTIAATANNGNIIGAAYNARLMLINAASYTSDSKAPGFEISDIIEAIDYAIENKADIINMSLGAITTSSTLENAVNKAYKAGIAIIASAGNDSVSAASKRSIPASYPNVIGVMASDKANVGQLAEFSNYDPTGIYYDIVAPGTEILSCSVQAGRVAYSNGTSQASPLVAACAAMYLSEYPDSTVDDLYDAIRNSPTQQVRSNSSVTTSTYYFKFLNANELLGYGKITPEIIFNLDTTVTKDPSLNYIYGLDERYTDIYDYISVADGTGTTEFIPSENGNGTGSILNVYDNDGNLFSTYHIIIFGDLNGDAIADGQDAVIASFIIDSPALFENHYKYAADVDFDNFVTENDYYITANYAVGKDFIFQSK